MATSLSINKNRQLSHAEDYTFLRRKGIERIQELCGNSWTDYNEHDPGITLLEAICYAITDLGYRASFDIKDLLASPAPGPADWENIFYTAARILPCNPVTITDYRKMVVDIPGVRNAWIEKSGEYEVPLFLEREEKNWHLTYDPEKSHDMLPLEGLYRVIVELEDDVLRENRDEEVIAKVKEKLHRHRNLCEDFIVICPVEYEMFAMEAEIRIIEGADIELINAKVYKAIRDLFSPAVNFYTLEQMKQRGYRAEEIFEGPLLHHGFIDPVELEGTAGSKDIRLSDIISRITDIEGVIAIEKMTLPKDMPSLFSDFSAWMGHVRDQQRTPRLDTERSTISFIRNGDRHRNIAGKTADPERVKALLRALLVDSRKVKLKSYEKEWEIPVGEYMDPEDYYPFQRTLPACYKMEERFIKEHIDAAEQIRGLDKEKKAVLQLRGFLLLFEQLMADYLSQLGHIRELFSFDPTVEATYFTQIPQGIHDYEALFIDYRAYKAQVRELAERNVVRFERRNRMLDHLMARMAENMDAERSIADKISFLQDYIECSNYRGRGFDYNQSREVWDTNAVEGVKKRVCRLLGMPGYERKTIASGALYVEEIRHENDIKRFVAKLQDPEKREVLLLQSVEYETRKEAEAALGYILEHGSDRHLYEAKEKHEKSQYHLKRVTEEGDGEIIASAHFQHRDEMERSFERTIEVLKSFSLDENFHLLEHILLRPRISGRGTSERGRHGIIGKEVVALLPLQGQVTVGPVAGPGDGGPAGGAASGRQIRSGQTEGGGRENAPYRFRMEKGKDPEGKEGWKLSLVNSRHEEIFSAPEYFPFYKHLTQRIGHIRSIAVDRGNYSIADVEDGRFAFRIMEGDRVLAQGKKPYKDKAKADEEVRELLRFFAYDRHQEYPPEEDLDRWAEADPYSFQVTVVLPDWPARFREPGFRHLLEKTLFMEMPAHIYPHVYWIDHHEMRRFEEAYKLWLDEQMNAAIPNTEIVNNMLFQLNELQSQ